jgi:phosphoribosylformimino-5-aminoimidazole carboxamide ribotide isomerase
MDLYCAVDIFDGGAVRLTQGDFDVRSDHGDPVALALRYVAAGARFLHVVDLNAARDGQPVNRETVLRVIAEAGVPVQVGGGARGYSDVTDLLDAGASRVVVSTLAAEEPDLVIELADRYPDRIVLGLDYRTVEGDSDPTGGRAGGVAGQVVAVRGWKQVSAVSVEAFLGSFASAPLGAIVVTSIARDGMLGGPDISGLTEVLARSVHPVVASGGVRSVADLAALAGITVRVQDGSDRRIAAAVVGRALADGSLPVREAVAACEPSG